jgi:hypothetical protein
MILKKSAIPRWLLFAAAHLFLLHLFAGTIQWADLQVPFRLYWNSFHLDNEISVGTWFNSMLLLGVSVSAFWVGRSTELEADRRPWAVIAVLFFLLSADEVGTIHEQMSRTVRLRFDLPSYLQYAWVLPAAAFVLLLTLYFARFVFRQKMHVRNGIVAAAAIYLSGALGFEMLGAHFATMEGKETLSYILACGFEELLEMCGCIRMIEATIQALPSGASIQLAD